MLSLWKDINSRSSSRCRFFRSKFPLHRRGSFTGRSVGCLGAENGIDIIVDRIWLKIFRLFSETEVKDRELQFAVNSDEGTSAAGSVEFCNDNSVEAERFMKYLCLLDRVRAETSVGDEKRVVRRFRILFLQNALNLRQLLH